MEHIRRMASRALLVGSLLIGVMLVGTVAASRSVAVAATTITVDTTDDAAAVDGRCSLRGAIVAANTDSAVDTCPAGSGADTITLATSATYTLTSDLPALTSAISIDGHDSTIDADLRYSGRLITVESPSEVTLDHLTITGAWTGTEGLGGGGIFNGGGTVTVTNSTISGNIASWGSGGGIFNAGGSVTVTNSTISDNEAWRSGRGGGIFNEGGTVTVKDSTIIGNDTDFTSGGGIFNAGGSVTVTNSTISDNTVFPGSFGGGIFSSGGSVTVKNSTISGNGGADRGGGLAAVGGSMTIENSTITGNNANAGGGIYNAGGAVTVTNSTISDNAVDYRGGGIYNVNNTVDVSHSTITNNSASSGAGISSAGGARTITTVTASIVAGNSRGDVSLLATDLTDSFLSGGFNVIGRLGAGIDAFAGDLTGQDPLLGILSDNGGATLTHLPAAASPAIDAGANQGCPINDQRGISRPQGTTCDAGSVEAEDVAAATTTTTLAVNPAATGPSLPSTGRSTPTISLIAVVLMFGGLALVRSARPRTH